MRILYLSWNYAPVIGGMEAVVTQLFRALRRAGLDVTLVTAHSPDAPPEDGVRRAPLSGLIAYLVYALTAGLAIGWKARPDAILCGSVVTSPVAWVLSGLFRRPYVVPVFGSDVLFDHALYRAVVRFTLARAAQVVAGSQQCVRLAADAGYDTANWEVIHPGVDVAPFDEDPDEAPFEEETEGRVVLLSVGRLVRRKGIGEFIDEVMPRLVAEDPRVLLLVVGGDATASLAHRERLRDSITTTVLRRGLIGHVRLLGELPDEDVHALFRRADLFVLPVRDLPDDIEGFGIVFLEAALARTACVATRVGGIPEAVLDGETGVLVAPGDADALYVAIRDLLRDPARRESLGAAGERRARSEFAWSFVAEKHEALLRRVAAR